MNVSSVKNLNGEIFSAVQDTALTDVVQTNSAQWGQGGGGSVSSKYGTITVDGSDIEATNSAIEFKSNWFTSSFGYISLDENNSPQSIAWDNYSEGTTLTLFVMNHDDSDGLTYSSNTNVTGLITAPKWRPTEVSLSLPNATAVQFSANHRYDFNSILVTATSSFQVKELAWASALPTFEYDNTNKISAINGSALAGVEVSHDNTLSGNGTVDSPLGVVPGYNETVLWSGTRTSAVTLSEPITNFESIKIYHNAYCDEFTGLSAPSEFRFWHMYGSSAQATFKCAMVQTFITDSTHINIGNTKTLGFGFTATDFTAAVTNNDQDARAIITKVVGINRIAGSN